MKTAGPFLCSKSFFFKVSWRPFSVDVAEAGGQRNGAGVRRGHGQSHFYCPTHDQVNLSDELPRDCCKATLCAAQGRKAARSDRDVSSILSLVRPVSPAATGGVADVPAAAARGRLCSHCASGPEQRP